MSEVKKVKKQPSEGQKNPKKRAEGHRKMEMLKAEVKKMPKNTRQIPKTIFTSRFIFRLTNFNDLSFFN